MNTRKFVAVMLLCVMTLLPQTVAAQEAYLPFMAKPTASVVAVTPEPVWTAQWWQWIARLNNGPLFEQGAVDCTVGQEGTVWFLAGTQGGSAVRSCTIPADKTYVVPILTVAWGNEAGENLTVPEKRTVLSDVFSDSVPGILNTKLCHLESRIDGEVVKSERVQSPTFLHIGDPAGVSDGYWLAFKLGAGQHTVHFAGTLCDFTSGLSAFDVDVTYNLTVE